MFQQVSGPFIRKRRTSAGPLPSRCAVDGRRASQHHQAGRRWSTFRAGATASPSPPCKVCANFRRTGRGQNGGKSSLWAGQGAAWRGLFCREKAPLTAFLARPDHVAGLEAFGGLQPAQRMIAGRRQAHVAREAFVRAPRRGDFEPVIARKRDEVLPGAAALFFHCPGRRGTSHGLRNAGGATRGQKFFPQPLEKWPERFSR
jgi:hypothetical protein